MPLYEFLGKQPIGYYIKNIYRQTLNKIVVAIFEILKIFLFWEGGLRGSYIKHYIPGKNILKT